MKNPRTLNDAAAWIAERKPFDCGNMSARSYPAPVHIHPGWNSMLRPGPVVYAVFSYSTPIGWIDDLGRAVVPPETHSNSTSRHQGIVRCALKGDPVEGKRVEKARVKRDEEEMDIIERWHERKAEERRARQREANRLRYWTPERIAAKEAREAVKYRQEVLTSILNDSQYASGVH